MATIAHVLHVVKDVDAAMGNATVATLVERLDTYQHSIAAFSSNTRLTIELHGATVHFFGPGIAGLWRFWRLLRSLKPQVLHSHTRDALPLHGLAAASGVLARVHGEYEALGAAATEHAMQVQRWQRFAHHFVAGSRKIEKQLVQTGIEPGRVSQIYDGVECTAVLAQREHAANPPVLDQTFVVAAIEDGAQLTTLQAWLRLLRDAPALMQRARLVLSLPETVQPQAQALVLQHGLAQSVTLCARREDFWAALARAHLFVSQCVHRSHAGILQAMVQRLPVVALDIENELLVPGQTGELVPVGDTVALSRALLGFVQHPQKAHAQGRAARLRAVQLFSIDGVVNRYAALYQMLLQRGGVVPEMRSVHG